MVVSHPGAQRASAGSPGFADRLVDRSRRSTRIFIAALLVAFVGGVVVAAGAPRAVEAGEGRLKAVVIIGPTGHMTDEYLRWGEVIARTAEQNGMHVARVYHPRATWARVREETRGANLIVYLGHGFGWPSPYPKSLFESQMDGFGLNYPDPSKRSAYQTHYYGAEKVRKSLQFAQNAVVILNHLCYSAGHGEMHHARPTRSVAVRRVDNFANGFLKVGAGVVFALAFQPGETIVDALFGKAGNTMEDLFRRRFNSGGWNGHSPSRHGSQRTPGAQIILDPHSQQSYRRAITGNLQMTAGQWRNGTPPAPDTSAPELTGLTASAGGETTGPDAPEPVSFSPNDDGAADQVTFDFHVSESSTVDLTIAPNTGSEEPASVVRTISEAADGGGGSATWNGRGEDGALVPDGRYTVSAIATDSSGNVSPAQSVDVRVLSVLRSPGWDSHGIHARDGDELAASAAYGVTLEREASVQVTIKDSQGAVVRSLRPDSTAAAGPLQVSWDGLDDAGANVADGSYSAVVVATTEQGTQRFVSPIWVGPFRLSVSDTTPRRGQRLRFRLVSTERLAARPTLTLKQPGLASETFTMRAVDGDPFRYRLVKQLKARSGTGQLTVTINGTDVGGGAERSVERYPLS